MIVKSFESNQAIYQPHMPVILLLFTCLEFRLLSRNGRKREKKLKENTTFFLNRKKRKKKLLLEYGILMLIIKIKEKRSKSSMFNDYSIYIQTNVGLYICIY